MPDMPPISLLASAAVLALALGQPLMAEEAAPAQPAETEAAAAPATAPASAEPTAAVPTAEGAPAPADQGAATTGASEAAESARQKSEERRAEAQKERNERYQELRERAADVGLELPETPPWESAESGMPGTPAMPFGMSPEDMDAMREERAAMREKMRTMTPEERQAMREAHWSSMRERAAERGVQMPETPPWAEAEKRRQEMQERIESYRKIIEEMTDEQREAARAMFGQAPEMQGPGMQGPPPAMQPWGQGYRPYGGFPGQMPYQGGPGGGQVGPDWDGGGGPGMMPYYGMPSQDQGPLPPMPQGGGRY